MKIMYYDDLNSSYLKFDIWCVLFVTSTVRLIVKNFIYLEHQISNVKHKILKFKIAKYVLHRSEGTEFIVIIYIKLSAPKSNKRWKNKKNKILRSF